MKYKTTNKAQKENNYIIIAFGYCSIQNIERYLTARAYTCGVYGWRADFYECDGFTISTGYDPLEYAYNKQAKKQAEYIKREILKLEKALEARRYSFQKGGDWSRGNKFIINKLSAIYKKSLEIVAK